MAQNRNLSAPKVGMTSAQKFGVQAPLAIATSVAGGYVLGKWVFSSSKFWPVFLGPLAGGIVEIPFQMMLGEADDGESAASAAGYFVLIPFYFLAAYAGLRLARK